LHRLPRTASLSFYDERRQSKTHALSTFDTLNLILLCHAATRAMKTGRFPRRDDPVEHAPDAPLIVQPALQRARLIASPALAARETAASIAQACDIDPAFDDLDYGRWRGASIRETGEREPDAIAAWLRDPHARAHGGESIAMVAERVAEALTRLASKDEACIVVTHAIVVKTALAFIRGEPLEHVFRIDIAPLSITHITHTTHDGHDRWRAELRPAL
jgi:broad specificity phosphatase PhoE